MDKKKLVFDPNVIVTEKQIHDIAKSFKLKVLINSFPDKGSCIIKVIYPKWYQFIQRHYYYSNFSLFYKYIEYYRPAGLLFNIN